MVSREELLPYDKTRLSKVQHFDTNSTNFCLDLPLVFKSWGLPPWLQVMNVESSTILLRSEEFFHQYNIEVWLQKEVSDPYTACLPCLRFKM